MGIDIMIKCLAAVGTALAASFAGTALFRIGSRQTEKERREAEEDKKPQPAAGLRTGPQALWQAGMYAGNLGAAVFLTIFYRAQPLSVLRIAFFCALLWACAWTDCKCYLIPNRILFTGLLVYIGLFIAQAALEPAGIRYAALGAGVSAAGLFVAGMLCRTVVPGSVGFGDLKLFVVMGLYLGAENTWNAVFYTLLAAFAVSVFLLVTKRASRKSVMPFAPFLLFGTLLAVFLNGV